MRFTVIWTPTAEDDLAAAWLTSTDRPAVTSAAEAFNETLANNPAECGESRTGNVRVAFVPPLGFEFEVIPDDAIVYVLAA